MVIREAEKREMGKRDRKKQRRERERWRRDTLKNIEENGEKIQKRERER